MIVAGDSIRSMFSFPYNVFAYWNSIKTRDHWNTRFTDHDTWGIDIYGTKGILSFRSGVGFAWWNSPFPAKLENAIWQPLPEPQSWYSPAHSSNMAVNLLYAIENDTQPLCSMYDGRWAIEMVSAVYQSHLSQSRVALPLKERGNPLT